MKKKETRSKTKEKLKQISQTYFILFLLCVLACQIFYPKWLTIFSLSTLMISSAHLIMLTILVVLLVLAMDYVIESCSPVFKVHKKFLRQLIGRLNTYQIFYLSAIAAVTEEMFLRVTLQPTLGIFFTSLIVGLVHMKPQVRFSLWMVGSVFFRSILFGILFYYTKSIYPCVVAHFSLNMINLFKYQRNETKVLKKKLSKL